MYLISGMAAFQTLFIHIVAAPFAMFTNYLPQAPHETYKHGPRERVGERDKPHGGDAMSFPTLCVCVRVCERKSVCVFEPVHVHVGVCICVSVLHAHKLPYVTVLQ